jgi:hypothetical protein
MSSSRCSASLGSGAAWFAWRHRGLLEKEQEEGGHQAIIFGLLAGLLLIPGRFRTSALSAVATLVPAGIRKRLRKRACWKVAGMSDDEVNAAALFRTNFMQKRVFWRLTLTWQK